MKVPKASPEPQGSAARLELERVSVIYPGSLTPALSEVTLQVAPGEVAALLGANGSGKSTLLRVAAGLVEPSQGSARVGGREIRAASRREIARRVAFVGQSEGVPAGFRVRDVVAMGRAPHQGIWMRESPEDRTAVEEAIVRCELRAFVDRPVENLSGGEQRRVAIARALAQRPSVLLLDEPAAFLDVRYRLAFYGLLAEAARRDRIACVVAMHDLDAAARFATSAAIVSGGRLVASGEPGEVMTAERLGAALGAELAVGVHAPSGERYFLPVKTR